MSARKKIPTATSTTDSVLQALSMGAVFLRVLRGEDPAVLAAEAAAIATKGEKLVVDIERFVGEVKDEQRGGKHG